MITIDKEMVTGWEAAIRGMRNPMNSWEKSDTKFFDCTIYDNDYYAYHYISGKEDDEDNSIEWHKWPGSCDIPWIGPNDMKLMKSLVNGGSEHAKFRRVIKVSVDVVAPLYWWKEMDTYKVGTTRLSCSTMHKIHAKEFELDDFSHEHVISVEASDLITEDDDDLYCIAEIWKEEDGCPQLMSPNGDLVVTVKLLNRARELYLKTKNKKYWWQMIQLLPSSYNQRATLDLNYEVLANIYHQRRGHKLDEWYDFCHWIEELPYAKELIIGFKMRNDILPPTIIDIDRVGFRYAEEGGAEKDGIIEIRRDVYDLSLGGALYAQVRIATSKDTYIKGMAIYSDDLPDGIDILVNTKKTKGETVVRDMDYLCSFSIYSNQEVRQLFYVDPDGYSKSRFRAAATGDALRLSPINILADSGDWEEWKNNLPTEFLAKTALWVD